MIETSPFLIAQRFVGTREVAGTMSNPLILAFLRLDTSWPDKDDVPWCSAFANFCCWLIRVARSKSLAARSWLAVGIAKTLEEAVVGFDVIILKRGVGEQPGSEVLNAPGHVGFFAGLDGDAVLVLGGNQSDSVSVARFPRSQVLGVRRLA